MRLIIFTVMFVPCLALAQDAGWGGSLMSLLSEYWPVVAIALLDWLVELSPLKSNSLVSLLYAPLKKFLEGFKKK